MEKLTLPLIMKPSKRPLRVKTSRNGPGICWNPSFKEESVKFFQCSINIYILQDKHYFLDCLNWEQQIINDKIIYNKMLYITHNRGINFRGPFPTCFPSQELFSLKLYLSFPSFYLFRKVVQAGNGTSQIVTINLITFTTCCECN